MQINMSLYFTSLINRRSCTILLLLLWITKLSAQHSYRDSGGPLRPYQAVYDVTHYALSVHVFPEDSAISGKVIMTASMVHPSDMVEMDLDPLLSIEELFLIKEGNEYPINYEHKEGIIHIQLPVVMQAGKEIQLAVSYKGKPRVAPRPPWDGGLSWARTADGSPWIATSCQINGADLWWPCKDHVSDEPDSMSIQIRVPSTLVAASNGKQLGIEDHKDGSTSYHWKVSTPINIYNVALNIAPYELIEGSNTSPDGFEYPVYFWVLPEDLDKGKKLFPQIIEHLQFYEKLLGPYPFRADKYGVAQTPHLGMEHQTVIAYGANFKNTSMTGSDWGFDNLHHHELGHEWWGNLVTASDWRDMWIHEGFCTYMQALYVEEHVGKEGLIEFMKKSRGFGNERAIAPMGSKSVQEIYRAPIYNKGAWVLHSLRSYIGDRDFFSSLRKMCYPNKASELTTDGSQTHFASTSEFIRLAENISGKELKWMFDVYVRQPKLPVLQMKREGDQMEFTWKAPDKLPFYMPIEIKVNGEEMLLEMENGTTKVNIPNDAKIELDPNVKVLFEAEEAPKLQQGE